MEAFLFQMQISNQLYLKGEEDIKLYPTGLCRPTRSSSLPHWLNPRNLLTFANAVKHCSNLYVQCLQLVCVNLRSLGLFVSFRFAWSC